MKTIRFISLFVVLAGFFPAARAAEHARIQAILIAASNDHGKSDQRLAAYEPTLKSILRFESYRFLGSDSTSLGVPASAVTTLKGPRLDIINAINLGRPIPVADGSTGDVITLDAAIDSQFPNGRRLGGGTAANRHQVNVNSVLISLIAAGDPGAGLAKGVETNDKDFLSRFPFLAPPHQGLLQGHGGTNATTVPNIPNPNAPQPCQ